MLSGFELYISSLGAPDLRKSNLERGLRSHDHLSQNVSASGLF